jgi:hypothetical protein
MTEEKVDRLIPLYVSIDLVDAVAGVENNVVIFALH